MFTEKSKEGDEIKDDLELSDSEEDNDNEANDKKVYLNLNTKQCIVMFYFARTKANHIGSSQHLFQAFLQ